VSESAEHVNRISVLITYEDLEPFIFGPELADDFVPSFHSLLKIPAAKIEHQKFDSFVSSIFDRVRTSDKRFGRLTSAESKSLPDGSAS
jgi:hypothetical protein